MIRAAAFALASLVLTAQPAFANGLIQRVERLDGEHRLDWIKAEVDPARWKPHGTEGQPSAHHAFHYTRTAEGLVLLTGLMSGCPDRQNPVFVLAEGHRPARIHVVPVASAQMLSASGGQAYPGHVHIRPNGRVMFRGPYRDPYVAEKLKETGVVDTCLDGAGQSWMSLSGVIFPAADSLEAPE